VQQIYLVHHEDYLLAPVADELQILALGLGEAPVDGGDEEDQVATRDEAAGQLLFGGG